MAAAARVWPSIPYFRLEMAPREWEFGFMGKDLSARLAAAHVLYWLQTPLNATVSKQLKLLLQLPRHVNQEEFKSHLVEKIGKPEFSEAFDTDECITVMKQIS